MKKVLVVSANPSVREAVALALESPGFELDAARGGSDAKAAFDVIECDIVVLDLGEGTDDELEICRHIRSTSSVPIVLLADRADSTNLARGLGLGADDYVIEPLDSSLLVERVRAAVYPDVVSESPKWRIRDLHLDEEAFRAERAGRPLDLTETEFRLLAVLARHPGQVLSKEVLLDRVWGDDDRRDARVVDAAILRLRTKIGDSHEAPALITRVGSGGYRFERD